MKRKADRLTDKERAFVHYLASGLQRAEAYTKAGYKATKKVNASAGACKLLERDIVLKEYKRLKDLQIKPFLMSIDERKKILVDIMSDETSNKREVMQALDLLNKMEAVYTNKTEITGANGGELKISWQK